jgi:hypothetical protein
MMPGLLGEGWYLMNTEELELELARYRGEDVPASSAIPLSIDEALGYRNRGNTPDGAGRTLRLVLHVQNRDELKKLGLKRLIYEPDHHERPDWRGPRSVPVNVVPLRVDELGPAHESGWWEDPDLSELESEWRATGEVGGIKVSRERRGFVFKTVLSLRAAGKAITPESVANSVARWLPEAEATALHAELMTANSSADQADSNIGERTS